MILTGRKIVKELKRKKITISPFVQENVNPNSYNYRIGGTIREFVRTEKGVPVFRTIKIPSQGLVLKPKQLYLSSTLETIGSSKYATSLIGRSSLGRLGLFLQHSANLGHTGTCHKWTLEIMAVLPIIIYPRMIIGQVSFWSNNGKIDKYEGDYMRFNNPKESLFANI